MKYLPKFIILFLLIFLSSCQRGCQKFDRSVQLSERYYEITVYSGGEAVYTDKFKGIVNNSESSDGIYYYKDGQLIEISGDYILKSN